MINHNYKKNIFRIKAILKKNNKFKVRVGFLVNENQKWNCQSLYEELEKHPKFQPIILVTLMTQVHDGNDSTRNNLQENYNFFLKKGMRVEKAYNLKTKSYVSLDKFKINILFYTQPWGLDEKQNIKNVSNFALCCYVPYSFDMFAHENNYFSSFHGLLWKYFLETNYHLRLFKKTHKINNCVVTGYPKLDTYLENKKINKKMIWPVFKIKKIKRIIYAPHHSFTPTPLTLSTFNWNGNAILEMARNSLNTIWVFKPHPNLKYNYIQTYPNKKKEIEKYFKQWRTLKNAKIYTQGDYFDLFKTSDALITDCGSFLAEYLFTKKPILHLRTKLQNRPFNKIGKKIIENYYQIYNLDELKNIFNRVILDNDDYLKKKRLASIKELGIDYSMSSAKKITKHFEEILKI